MLFPARPPAASARRSALLLVARAAAAASRCGCAYAAWRMRRQAIRELAALDDRTLKDLGIHRSEIESLVCGRDWELATESKITAFLFHKPYKSRGCRNE
jgi:uncharacterized protein YjiS (DUF1127 family)